MYSVIVSSYGRFEFLKELYISLMKQTLIPQEIIFLLHENKFNKENYKKLNFGKESKFIFKSLNLSEKRNYGAKVANTEYLFFSDDDDIWAPQKAELCLKELGTNQVLVHAFTKFGFKIQKPQLFHGDKICNIPINSILSGTNVWGGGSSILAKKELVLNINFKESLTTCEDYDWFVRLMLADIQIKYLPYPLVSYRSHEKNMTNNLKKQNIVAIKTCSLFLKKSIYLFYGSSFAIFKSFLNLLLYYFNKTGFPLNKKIK